MMKYCCSIYCSVCLCTPSLTQSTTGLQAAVQPSIPLPAPRANPLVEREHPKFGNTGLSASDDHSANVTFNERPPWPDVHFLPDRLLPHRLHRPQACLALVTLTMAGFSNLTTKIVDKGLGQSGVEYKYEFRPVLLATRLAGTAQNGTCHI